MLSLWAALAAIRIASLSKAVVLFFEPFGLPFPAAGGRRLAALSFTSLVRLPKLLLVFLTGLVVTALASCHHRFEIGLGAAGTYRHYLFSPLFKDVGQPSALNASKERDGMLLDILAVRPACVLRPVSCRPS